MPIPTREPVSETEKKPLIPEKYRPYLWQGKPLPAFWSIAGAFSIVVNIILIAVLLGVVRYVFTLKSLIGTELIGGLHDNFVNMDEANIVTMVHVNDTIQVADTIQVIDTITVTDSIPVVFDLQIDQDTQVVLTQDTPIYNVPIILNGQAVPVSLTLPRGTPLSIHLNMSVPVDKVVPVNLIVPVALTVPVLLDVPVSMDIPIDIPLNQTELHDPFVGLRQVVQPYNAILRNLPNGWNETPFCGKLTRSVCNWLDARDN